MQLKHAKQTLNMHPPRTNKWINNMTIQETHTQKNENETDNNKNNKQESKQQLQTHNNIVISHM